MSILWFKEVDCGVSYSRSNVAFGGDLSGFIRAKVLTVTHLDGGQVIPVRLRVARFNKKKPFNLSQFFLRVAKSGIARALGARDRKFKSYHADQILWQRYPMGSCARRGDTLVTEDCGTRWCMGKHCGSGIRSGQVKLLSLSPFGMKCKW